MGTWDLGGSGLRDPGLAAVVGGLAAAVGGLAAAGGFTGPCFTAMGVLAGAAGLAAGMRAVAMGLAVLVRSVVVTGFLVLIGLGDVLEEALFGIFLLEKLRYYLYACIFCQQPESTKL